MIITIHNWDINYNFYNDVLGYNQSSALGGREGNLGLPREISTSATTYILFCYLVSILFLLTRDVISCKVYDDGDC